MISDPRKSDPGSDTLTASRLRYPATWRAKEGGEVSVLTAPPVLVADRLRLPHRIPSICTLATRNNVEDSRGLLEGGLLRIFCVSCRKMPSNAES